MTLNPLCLKHLVIFPSSVAFSAHSHIIESFGIYFIKGATAFSGVYNSSPLLYVYILSVLKPIIYFLLSNF